MSPTQPMYLPGRIVHLSDDRNGSFVDATWVSKYDFMEILVTPKASVDHLPDRVEHVVDEACTRHHRAARLG